MAEEEFGRDRLKISILLKAFTALNNQIALNGGGWVMWYIYTFYVRSLALHGYFQDNCKTYQKLCEC